MLTRATRSQGSVLSLLLLLFMLIFLVADFPRGAFHAFRVLHDRNRDSTVSPPSAHSSTAEEKLSPWLHVHLYRSMKPPVQQFTCIVDLQGFGMSNIDSNMAKTAAHMLQSYYPERCA